MRTRLLTAALASALLSFGMGAAMAQMTPAPADNEQTPNTNPTKAPGKRTDPPSSSPDRSANAAAGDQVTPAAGGDDTAKPMHKKPRHHKKSMSKSSEPGGTNSAGDMSHSGVQSGGNDAATSTGNSQPGSSKQGQ